ncbi:MAG: M24 family metallopeptidase [Acidobacteriota bacterium]
MKNIGRFALLFMFLSVTCAAESYSQERTLTHREQAALRQTWLQQRFTTVLPELMRREGIDMWIIVSREYNDDPVFSSMAPLTTFASRRRTILVYIDRGPQEGVERLSVGRFDYGGLFNVIKTHNDEQWEGLSKLVAERDPKVIGINTSELYAHADGLSANEKENLLKALGPKYAGRLKSAENLAVGWLEVKTPQETDAFRHAMRIAHRIIAEAFSNQVIVPGVTTNEDVAWWMRQRAAELGLGIWFQPSVTVARKGGVQAGMSPHGTVIQRGDMLHCDFGIVYMGFCTDTQHNAYVLLPGESEAPEGLREGLKAANLLQDLTMQYAKAGVTGNAALAAALAQAKQEGLTPSIYCHPVGYHGHAAGPPIGMTDYQEGVPGRGGHILRPNTWHAIELNASHPVKEWNNQQVRFALEEDAILLRDGWQWINGRQTKFYLVR